MLMQRLHTVVLPLLFSQTDGVKAALCSSCHDDFPLARVLPEGSQGIYQSQRLKGILYVIVEVGVVE